MAITYAESGVAYDDADYLYDGTFTGVVPTTPLVGGGGLPPRKRKPLPPKPRRLVKCWHCGFMNSPVRVDCESCGYLLDFELAVAIAEAIAQQIAAEDELLVLDIF